MPTLTATAPLKPPPASPQAPPTATTDLKSLSLAELEQRLATSPDGLTQAEATTRLAQYGPKSWRKKPARC
jgi:H+-transporting ATPase